MAGECRLQTQRRSRDALGDLDQVIIRRRCVSPPVHASAERHDLSRVPKPVESLVADSGCSGFPVRESVAEQPPEIVRSGGAHGAQTYPPTPHPLFVLLLTPLI